MGGEGRKNREKRRRERWSEEDEEEEEEREKGDKYRRLSKFLDIDAIEASDDEEDDDGGDGNEDGFFVEEGDDGEEEEIPEDYEQGEVGGGRGLLRRTVYDDYDDVEAMEKMVNERYSKAAAAEYDQDFDDEAAATAVEQQFGVFPSVYDPKLWMVKCVPGHEKEMAALLTHKSMDKGSETRILSAFALDHLQNYIYVKAYKESDVKEACKGMSYIFSKNIIMVPLKEMKDVLSVENKSVVNVSIGDWVRLKRSNYKGSLAKIVDIDHVNLKVTVKVAPKMSSLSLDDKLEGINTFYKTVALSSVSTGDLQPSIEEIENFREIGETDKELATLFKGKQPECFERGDTVMMLKGELKNVKCSVEYVEGDLVHIKPNPKMHIPLKTIAVRKTDLVKHFEPGYHVKVVNGVHAGTTGMVIRVNKRELIILSDASKDQITVLSSQAVSSREVSESSFAGVAHRNQERSLKSSYSRHIPHLAPASGPPPAPRSFSTGQFAKRQDSMIGKLVKIIQGPYRGYRGCVKGVNGHNIRVELQAQMKVITVDRSHISDNLPVSNTNLNMQQDRQGSETPLHYPRTPMPSMGGETPWRTPRQSTPVHYSSVEPALGHWNPFSFTSPPRLTPTP